MKNPQKLAAVQTALVIGSMAVGFVAGAYVERSHTSATPTQTVQNQQPQAPQQPSAQQVTQPVMFNIPGTSMTAVEINKSDYAKFQAIPVTTPDGKTVHVDATKQPVMFLAWWCEYCHKSLQTMSTANISNPPVGISVWFKGKSFADAQSATLQSYKDNGLKTPLTTYYMQDDNLPSSYISGTPTLVMMYQGKLIAVVGGANTASEWETLLK